MTTESESERTDTPAEIEGVGETEIGTETEDLHDAMHDGMMMIGLQEGIIETCSMTEEEAVGDGVAEGVTVMNLEAEEENARRVLPLHPRRRSRPQI